MIKYEELEPKAFFKYFREISNIPRKSKKEELCAKYLEKFALDRGYEVNIDKANNVFIKVPATRGYENKDSVLLQAHTDMICKKDEGIEFDFEKDALVFELTDELLFAKGTTLGSDNAKGMAAMLAISENDSIPHPPLELLFTSQEEIGLVGIRAFDMSKIKARKMINFDCGETHTVCTSSAGVKKCIIKTTFETESPKEEETAIIITVSGGRGGHGGLQIASGLSCAANLIGNLLLAFSKNGISFKISSLKTSEGAILTRSEGVLLVNKRDIEKINAIITEQNKGIKRIYAQTDPEVGIDINTGIANVCVNAEASQKIAKLLALLNTGAFRLEGNKIITSAAIMRAEVENGKTEIAFNIRSLDDFDRDTLFEHYRSIVKAIGLELEVVDEYSGWNGEIKSNFKATLMKKHRELFGYEMQEESIHGGIEVGIVMGAIPQMDAVGFAPDSSGAHTTKERLYVKTVKPFWELFCALLAE